MKNYYIEDLYLAKISIIVGNSKDINGNNIVNCCDLDVAVVKKDGINLYSKKPVYVDVLTDERYYALLKQGIRGALVYDDNLVPLKNLINNKDKLSFREVLKIVKNINKKGNEFIDDLFDNQQTEITL